MKIMQDTPRKVSRITSDVKLSRSILFMAVFVRVLLQVFKLLYEFRLRVILNVCVHYYIPLQLRKCKPVCVITMLPSGCYSAGLFTSRSVKQINTINLLFAGTTFHYFYARKATVLSI